MKKIVIGLIIITIIALIVVIATKSKDESGSIEFGLSRPSSHNLFDAQVDNKVSISYDGGTDEIVTDTAHGLAVNDVVRFETASAAFGGADAPGFSESTDYFVVTASTTVAFEISTTRGGTALDIAANASAGGGEFFLQEMYSAANVDGKQLVSFTLDAEEAASADVRFVGSLDSDCPDFLSSKSHANSYDYLDVIDGEDASSIDGDTGFSFTGSDDHRIFYIDKPRTLNWVGAIIENFASGSFTITLDVF